MPRPDELVFALKTFAGAMTALLISFWLGLDNPYWSMATAYIVAQPLTGALRSKALYRFIGTLLGGTGAVILVPNLVNSPLLLSLGMAGWIGTCLYLSLLDRSPRAYVFMLAGYTAGIIGFPTVDTPHLVFQTAITRVEEISLGIVCTSIFGTVLFPRPLGPVLARRIIAWMQPAADWIVAALAGHEEDEQTRRSRRRLAAEAGDISMMTSHLGFDVSHLQGAVRHIVRLRLYVLSLMPVISSIGDRVVQLRSLNGITPRMQKLLDDCSDWIRHGYQAPASAADGLLAEIAAQVQENEAQLAWSSVLRLVLLERLHDMVSLVRHARLIRHNVIDQQSALPASLNLLEPPASLTELHDHGMAFLSAISAASALMLISAFWIFTSWPAGGGAAVMAAVACSFFSAMDDPAPAIQQMLRNALISLVGTAFYVFVVLPRVETFGELALVLLPPALLVGVLVSRPATFGTGMVVGSFGATNMALANGYNGNFAIFVNSSIALIVGIMAALTLTRLIRSVGAAFSARRLLRAGWRDIARAASPAGPQDRALLTGIMLDRLGLLAPRLAAVSEAADLAAADMLNDLRVGLNAIGLRHEMGFLTEAEKHKGAEVLAGIAAHYLGNPLAAADEALLRRIDESILSIVQQIDAEHGRQRREALKMLVGLRGVLFRDAPAPFGDLAVAA